MRMHPEDAAQRKLLRIEARKEIRCTPLEKKSEVEFLKSYEQEFWSRVDKANPKGCWIWKAHMQKGPDKGYGIFLITKDGKRYRVIAHRAAYVYAKGRVPPGHVVRDRKSVV